MTDIQKVLKVSADGKLFKVQLTDQTTSIIPRSSTPIDKSKHIIKLLNKDINHRKKAGLYQSDPNVYHVSKLLTHRYKNNHTQYLVQWQNEKFKNSKAPKRGKFKNCKIFKNIKCKSSCCQSECSNRDRSQPPSPKILKSTDL